jgi:hypothetical protein
MLLKLKNHTIPLRDTSYNGECTNKVICEFNPDGVWKIDGVILFGIVSSSKGCPFFMGKSV